MTTTAATTTTATTATTKAQRCSDKDNDDDNGRDNDDNNDNDDGNSNHADKDKGSEHYCHVIYKPQLLRRSCNYSNPSNNDSYTHNSNNRDRSGYNDGSAATITVTAAVSLAATAWQLQ